MLVQQPTPLATPAPAVVTLDDAHPNGPVPTLDTRHRDGQSRLEGLPAELRRHVLSVLDIHCLKGLVHASPTFHEQYLQNRRHLLSTSLHVTLGTVSLDAFVVQKAQALELGPLEFSSEPLDAWSEIWPHRASFQLAGLVTEDEAVAMVRFYVDFVAPVARYFMKEILSAMRSLDGSAGDISDTEPSSTECLRCTRVAYRFQLLCCANRPATLHTGSTIRETNVSRIFYTPEPWEAEELLTFYEFAENIYQGVFNDIAAEVNPYHPRFEDQDHLDLAVPVGSFCFHTTFTVRNYQEGTTLRGGLQLLRAVLIDLKSEEDLEPLVATMQRSIVESCIPISRMSGVLSSNFQREANQGSHRRPRDKLMKEHAPLLFQGDDLDRPPLGWTDIWDAKYSNLIGGFIPCEIRRWGYVFWDADRMNRHGRRHILSEQWTRCWDQDPREGFS